MRGGIIDLGSNSFRLLVADESGPVEHRSHHLGLARAVSQFGSLTSDDIQLATRTARELLRCAQDLRCDRIGIVATEAFRLAANGSAAVAHIEHHIDHSIHILSAAEEIAFAFQGTAGAMTSLDAMTLVDLGGGGLGIGSGPTAPARPAHHFNFQLGVELLAPRALEGDLLSTSTRIRLEHHIADELQPATRTLAQEPPRPMVLVGGAARALAQLIHTSRRGQVPADTHGLEVDATDLGHIIGRTSDLATPARLAIPGIKPRRASTLPLAATIVRQAMRSLGAEHAVVSTAGVRAGALLQLLQHQRRAA